MQAAVRNLFKLLKNEIGERSTLFLTEFYQIGQFQHVTSVSCCLNNGEIRGNIYGFKTFLLA